MGRKNPESMNTESAPRVIMDSKLDRSLQWGTVANMPNLF